MLVKQLRAPRFGGSPTGSLFPGAFQGQPKNIFLVQQPEIGNLQPLVPEFADDYFDSKGQFTTFLQLDKNWVLGAG